MLRITSMTISNSMDQLLLDLQNAITGLPFTLPEGTEDGPLAMHLCDFEVDEEEGPFYSFNRSWERAFQRNNAKKKKLVVHGKYGLQLAHNFMSHFARVPGIEANNGLTLIKARVEALLSLIYEVYVYYQHLLGLNHLKLFYQGSDTSEDCYYGSRQCTNPISKRPSPN